MKRLLLICLLGLLLLAASPVLGEVTVSCTPENPRMGDYVDVTVTTDLENVKGVLYQLTCDGEEIFSGKPVTHLNVSFRPRREGTYTLTVTVQYGKKEQEAAEVRIPVSGTAPAQEAPDVVYSQKDGWWKDKVYSAKNHRSVEKAGCALFALSHSLQRLGFSGEEIRPDSLAQAYSRFYVPERGTNVEGLLTQAARDYGFITQDQLITTEKEIADCLERGDLLTFGIVLGHIAMADGLSEDGTKVHIVDSCAGATYERKDRFKTKGHIYYRAGDGTFTEAATPEDLPGLRWFFESQEYGGMDYWMDLSYCAYRGMRLIRTPWLQAPADGEYQPAELEYAGALISKVTVNEESVRIPTADLRWETRGADTPQLAVVTNKKGTRLLDGKGNALSGVRLLVCGTMVPVLRLDDDTLYVVWQNTCGYLSRKNAELLPVRTEGAFQTGTISLNGKTAGAATVIVHLNPKANSVKVTEWKIGTPVAVVQEEDGFFLVEGKGVRGWVHSKYITLDLADEPESEEEKGE